MQNIMIAVLGMSILGLFWALVLVFANKQFFVKEDPLVEKVIETLPGVNCGACGFAGCGACGDAIVTKKESPTICPVCNDQTKEDIAEMLGRKIVKDPNQIKLIAKVHCAGSKKYLKLRAEKYNGYPSCAVENITGGGTKACTYGCLGHGDCVKVCPVEAIAMNSDGLPVVDEQKCISCEKCVLECPRSIIKMVPENQEVFILCSSKDPGKVARQVCDVSCIGCGICVKNEEQGSFQLKDFLATVDYQNSQKVSLEKLREVSTKCPRKIITVK